MKRWTSSAFCFVVSVCAIAGPASGQAAGPTGTVVGQVVSADAKTAIQGVQVIVQGTQVRAIANIEGRYTLRNVPTGSHTIRAQMLGFAAPAEHLQVAADGARNPD